MRGMLATAVEPSAATSSGTSRQPAGSRPSARHASSTTFRSHGSRRKHIARPAPRVPVSAGESGSSTPAPSPVTPSAAHAPRCATAARPASARSSSSREARPRDVGDEADAAGVAFEGAIVEKGVRAQGSPAFRGPGNGWTSLPPVCLSLVRRRREEAG